LDNTIGQEGLIYFGNDINDAECLKFAACAVGPNDAHPDITPLLHLKTNNRGGCGAVRELADVVCKALDSQRVKLA
jgi:3-deoxy-D-manno-octulosonate 8-phosphate phosphatase KdsC-like HAD superfamily phosphatase